MLGGQFMPGLLGTPPTAAVYNFIIDTDEEGTNLQSIYISSGAPWPPNAGDTCNFTILADVRIGGLQTGSWPAGVILNLTNNSLYVLGEGGNGSDGIDFGIPDPGDDGDTAFTVFSPINVDNTNGRFAGGGGGGSGSVEDGSGNYCGGGGGAGYPPGNGGSGDGSDPGHDGDDGTESAGGNGGSASSGAGGGDGGNLGQPGQASGDAGGAAGYSVSGYSLVTWINQGILLGPTTG